MNVIRKENISPTLKIVRLGDLVIRTLRGQMLSKKDMISSGKNKCIHYGQLYTTYGHVIEKVISYTNIVSKVLSNRGDILVPGSTTADAMGIATASVLLENNVILGGDINILRTNKKLIDSSYLAYLLSNAPVKQKLAAYARGTNILHLYAKDIIKLYIPLPSLKVQKKISVIMSTWDEAIEKAEGLIAALELQFKGLLSNFYRCKYSDNGSFTSSLREICLYKKGKPINTNEVGKGIPHIGSVNFDRIFTEYTEEQNIVKCKPDDILLLWDGAYAGKTTTDIKGSVGSTVMKLSPNDINRTNNFFIHYHMLNNKQRIRNICTGSGIPHIPKDFLKLYKIEFPPIAQQLKIVETLRSLDTKINLLKSLKGEYLKQKSGMMQALLNK